MYCYNTSIQVDSVDKTCTDIGCWILCILDMFNYTGTHIL
uniref:Uncharacterized protein n=1 Tax=Anguilla anguilla TaxID=7936 RepID=A0A0E9WAD7_ANGAN